jgi:hypothetical protein
MQIQFKSNSIPSPFCLKVCAVYKAPTVTVAGAMESDSSLAFSFECCISAINQGTSAQPQVNPLILRYLQKMACALANAVAWYASKQLTGQAPIINDNTRKFVNAAANEILNPVKYHCFAARYGGTPEIADQTEFVVIDKTSAWLKVFGKEFELSIANADDMLPELFKSLVKMKAVMTAYDDRMNNDDAPFAVFFGFTISQCIVSAKAMQKPAIGGESA